ncbi:MAG: hypothetical protein AAB381_02360 [Patescibacteria group bacterium]
MKTLEAATALQGYTLCGGWTKEARVTPGEQLIPAVHGEYYGYSAKFTLERPVFVFAKCKSNKARAVANIADLGQEANLLFRLGTADYKQVCSMTRARNLGLLEGSVTKDQFCETWIAPAPINAAEFHVFHSLDRLQDMVEMCTTACAKRQGQVNIEPGSVIVMMTNTGKYGMLLVKRLTKDLVLIDACHVLL